MKYADLHIHTNLSDGTNSLSEIFQLAQKAGISCISITDHDSVDAYLPGLAYDGIELIPGVEFTSDYQESEVHILGYGIDYQKPWLQEKLKSICQERIQRMIEICQKLTNLGMILDADEVIRFAGHSCVGRLHLARVMARKGLVSNTQEAFKKYIGDKCPAYVSRFRLKPQEVITLILRAGGVPVLAHPYSLANQEWIVEFVKSGLMGLEVIYPEHSPAKIAAYKDLAKKHNLIITGGSDFHGQGKPDVKIGIAKIPYELIEELKKARQRVLAS